MITFSPDTAYDRKSLDTVRIIIPDDSSTRGLYKFHVTVDGKEINFSLEPSTELQAVRKIIPFTCAIAKVIKQVYLVMNTFSCSYFVMSMIGFYNLTMFYYFLFLNTLPDFARIFIFNLAYVFIKGGSIQDTLNNYEWYRKNINLDFSQWPIEEKVPKFFESESWFGFFEISSNYLQSNIEPLVLISLLFFKFGLLNLIVKLLPNKFKNGISLSF